MCPGGRPVLSLSKDEGRPMIFDNLVVARVASLLNVSPVEVRKHGDQRAGPSSGPASKVSMFGQDSFFVLRLVRALLVQVKPSPATWTNVA